MAKANKTGRSRFVPYIKLHRGVTDSEAWKSLSCEARCVVLEVWARHNGQNNGRIVLSHREVRQALHIAPRRVVRAFREAVDRGFLIERSKGSFNCKVARATEWEITTEECDDKTPKAPYRDWGKKQNAGTAVVADGNHSGSRARKLSHEKGVHGNHSGSRQGGFADVHGNHSGSTYNLPSTSQNESAPKTSQNPSLSAGGDFANRRVAELKDALPWDDDVGEHPADRKAALH